MILSFIFTCLSRIISIVIGDPGFLVLVGQPLPGKVPIYDTLKQEIYKNLVKKISYEGFTLVMLNFLFLSMIFQDKNQPLKSSCVSSQGC